MTQFFEYFKFRACSVRAEIPKFQHPISGAISDFAWGASAPTPTQKEYRTEGAKKFFRFLKENTPHHFTF